MQEKLKSFLNYIEFEKRYSKHTLLAYRKDLEHLKVFLEEQYEVNDWIEVDAASLRNWVVNMMVGEDKKKMVVVSIQRKIAAMKSFFKFLMREKYINTNPASLIIAPKSGQRLPEYVQENEIQFLLEGIKYPSNFIGQRDKTIIELLYATGIRRAELLQLTHQNINLKTMMIKVLGKNDKERIIPIMPYMVEILNTYIQSKQDQFGTLNHHFLFVTQKGKPAYPKLIYNVVKKYLSQVTHTKLKGPHTLRHTFATHLSNQGADLNAIKELLGHSNLSATQIYVHNSIERLKEVYSKAHPKGEK